MWQSWERELGPVEGKRTRLWSGNALCTRTLGSLSAVGPTAARQQAAFRAQALLLSLANMELFYKERKMGLDKELLTNPQSTISTAFVPCLCSQSCRTSNTKGFSPSVTISAHAHTYRADGLRLCRQIMMAPACSCPQPCSPWDGMVSSS